MIYDQKIVTTQLVISISFSQNPHVDKQNISTTK